MLKLSLMIQVDYPKCMYRVTKRYLIGKEIKVKIGEKKSQERILKAGVPQGALLAFLVIL